MKGSVAQHSISVSACIVATGLRKGLTVTMTTNPTAQGQAQSVHIHQSSRLTAWLTTPRYRSRPAGFSNVLIAKIFSTGVCHKKQKFLGTKKPWICPTFNGLAQSVHQHQNQKLKNFATSSNLSSLSRRNQNCSIFFSVMLFDWFFEAFLTFADENFE